MSYAETHEHRIRRWDCTIPAIKSQTHFTSTPVRHVVSLGSDRFVTQDSKGQLTLFNANDLTPIPREGSPWQYSYALTAVDAQHLIGTIEYRDPCRLWDVESGSEISRFELLGPEDDDEPFWRAAQLAEHAVAARSMRYPVVTGSHYYARELYVVDGALFVENAEDMLYMWDIPTAKLQYAVDFSNVFAVPETDDILKRPRSDGVRPERRRIECVAPVSAREAFVCTRDNKIRKIDLAEQKVLWETVVAPDSWRLAHAISPEQILFTADENTVVLVDTRLSGPRRKSLWHNDQVIEVRVADAHTVMSCGKDQTVRAWDIYSGVAKFPAVKCPAEINAILPLDAARVICACKDGKSRLFDLQSTDLVHEFEGHKASVRSLVALASAGDPPALPGRQ
jgi:hypothetical protein